VFSAPVNYELVKIAHSNFEVVFRTTKYNMIYSNSGHLHGGNSFTTNDFILKMNRGYKG
jgi:hypothetical protein